MERGQGLCPYVVGAEQKEKEWACSTTERLSSSRCHSPFRNIPVVLVLLHFKIAWIFPQGAISVDSVAELENGALLLQILQLSQLSLPIGQRLLGSKRKMSLNPIAQQIPQIVETCCKFIEKHGKEASNG